MLSGSALERKEGGKLLQTLSLSGLSYIQLVALGVPSHLAEAESGTYSDRVIQSCM